MIVLRSLKGWTGPKIVDGLQIEGTFRAHQVPMIVDAEPVSYTHLDVYKRQSATPEAVPTENPNSDSPVTNGSIGSARSECLCIHK